MGVILDANGRVNVVGTNVVNTNVIIATGAGTDKCNGMYTWANIVSGMPSYTNNNGITELYYQPGWNRWYIGDIGGRFTYWYKDAEGSPTNTIFTDIGLNPAPTMVYYGVWNIH
jgi:hypothetical protein